MRYVKVWNPNAEKMVKRKTYKKPKGFSSFTDLSERKGLIGDGYEVRVGRNPYSGRGGKVLFYRKKGRKH